MPLRAPRGLDRLGGPQNEKDQKAKKNCLIAAIGSFLGVRCQVKDRRVLFKTREASNCS